MDDPQEPLFCRNTNAAADKTYPDQPGAIIAEKSVLAYQDYLLNLDGFDINLITRGEAARHLGIEADNTVYRLLLGLVRMKRLEKVGNLNKARYQRPKV
jgi:hypothetical protein